MIRTMLLIGLAITLIASNAASQSPSQPKRKLEGDERQALEPERGKLKKELLSPELLRRRAVPNELTIGDLKLNGSRLNPITVKVNWTIRHATDVRIEGYEITLQLANNGVNERVFQTPASGLTSVFVGLLGIPADKRAKLFTPGQTVEAAVTLKAKLISRDGKRFTLTETKNALL